MDYLKLLIAFLKDYSTDGNQITTYRESNLQKICYEHIISKYSKPQIINALLSVKLIEQEIFGEKSWMIPGDVYDAFEIEIEQIAKNIIKHNI